MRLPRPLIALATIIAVAVPGFSAANGWQLADGSTVTYYLHHPMHDVVGLSTAPTLHTPPTYDPTAPQNLDGVAGTVVQIPWASFDSGNQNRDANARATVKAGQYPMLTYVVEGLDLGDLADGVATGTATGRLYIAGAVNPTTATVSVDVADPKAVRVDVATEIDMTRWGIEPPSLLLVSADKEVRIAAELRFARAATAAAGAAEATATTGD